MANTRASKVAKAAQARAKILRSFSHLSKSQQKRSGVVTTRAAARSAHPDRYGCGRPRTARGPYTPSGSHNPSKGSLPSRDEGGLSNPGPSNPPQPPRRSNRDRKPSRKVRSNQAAGIGVAALFDHEPSVLARAPRAMGNRELRRLDLVTGFAGDEAINGFDRNSGVPRDRPPLGSGINGYAAFRGGVNPRGLGR